MLTFVRRERIIFKMDRCEANDTTTTKHIIDELRLIFAEHGLPEQLVSDNGPQLTSYEFVRFMRENRIKHTLVPPYHPASNGSVRVVKGALEKQLFTRNWKHDDEAQACQFPD